MLVQSREVSVIDRYVHMFAAPACRKSLVLIRMILHISGLKRGERLGHQQLVFVRFFEFASATLSCEVGLFDI